MVNLEYYENSKQYVNGKKVSKYNRSFLYDTETGNIYMPFLEKTDFLCASYDGYDIAMNGKNYYVPLEYLKKEYPDMTKALGVIENRIRTFLEKG